jgi:hypothetical protein
MTQVLANSAFTSALCVYGLLTFGGPLASGLPLTPVAKALLFGAMGWVGSG